MTAFLAAALVADHVVLGGGNARKLRGQLPGVRLGHNLSAFRGGLRLWNIEYAVTLSAEGEQPPVHRVTPDRLAGGLNHWLAPSTIGIQSAGRLVVWEDRFDGQRQPGEGAS